MKYIYKSFTLPAGSGNKTQQDWDYSTLSKSEFVAKYGAEVYDSYAR